MRVSTNAGLDLDALYRSIFDGPTPAIPEEDLKESEFVQADTHYNVVSVFNTEKQAHDILLDVDRFMSWAICDIISARDAAGYDCWGAGGVWADMSENNSLVSCEHARQVERLITQAQRIQPAVRDTSDMRIANLRR
jgi:hypothetical protein